VGDFWHVVSEADQLRGIAGRSSSELVAEGLKPELSERVVSLLKESLAVALAAERLEQQGISTITSFDDAYPQRLLARLQDVAPPILHVAGDPSIISIAGIGIVGSRNVDEKGIEVAQQAATVAADAGIPVISGGARGIDQQAMRAAHRAGGQVVGILGDSLLRQVKDPDERRLILEGRVALVSTHRPDLGFTVARAMARNKVIYALSEVTLVVACTEGKGGTWEGASESLRRDFGRVKVWVGDGSPSGNGALAAMGAMPVEKIDLPGLIDVEAESDKGVPEQLGLLGEQRPGFS
jgi:predicted Rossmann fold nucleotide-binding protein DprA/Smf involved in DNA uptake